MHRKRGEFADAVQCFERAASLGHADALFALATAYGRGEGVPKDEHLPKDENLPKDEQKMRSLTVEAAEKGHVEAQYWVGNYFRCGSGDFPKDFERAVYWYQRAADADHPKALYWLGLHTMLGQGVAQDIPKGWDLTERAAKLGEVEAMMSLASSVDSGKASKAALEEAFNWYRKAADKGNADAQLVVGTRLLESAQGPDEKRLARQYLEKAAKQGNAEARSILDTLPEDPEPAAPRPVLTSAVVGDPQAQYQLGVSHYMGIGVPKSFSLSYFWFSVLAKTLQEQAAQMLQLLAPQLPSDVREALDRAAAQWQPGTPPPEIAA
jgi:TPR repeat protein